MKVILLFGFVLLAHSAQGQSVSLTSIYHAYNTFFVGDAWTLAIAGAAPDSLVQISATQTGTSLGTASFGDTDGSGNWSLMGTMDSSTVGTWVEDIYVGGNYIGELEFTVSTPATCSYGDSGEGYMYSTDTYYRYEGEMPLAYVSYISGTSVYHDIYGGLGCYFTGASGGYGSWIEASYTTSATENVFTLVDSMGTLGREPSFDSSGCPRCYDHLPPDYSYYNYYPVLDYATVSSNVYNSEANTVQVLNTLVML